MRVRLATIRDITRITDIVIAGLPDDPTFDYLWRYRHLYPDDNYFFWLQKLKSDLFNPKNTFLVLEHTEEKDDLREKSRGDAQSSVIVAFAIWERNGQSDIAKSRIRKKNTWLNYTQSNVSCYLSYASLPKTIKSNPVLILGSTARLEDWTISLQFSRRDGDLERFNNFLAIHGLVHQKYWTLKYPENFHLVLLCTHPDYRLRGAGTALVSWGLAEAAMEGVVAGVEASPMGIPLYRKLGFEMIDTLIVRKRGEEQFLPVPVMVCLEPTTLEHKS